MTGREYSVTASVCCHMGSKRTSNEDNYYLNGTWKTLEQQNNNQLHTCSAALPALFAVCDGMGGHQHGEIASLLAATWLHQCRTSFLEGHHPQHQGASALIQMSRQLWHGSQSRGIHMGSTVVAVAVRDNATYIYGLGDSRAYLLNQEGLRQLSQDHTMAAQAQYFGLTGGQPLPSEDPRCHQLTQYLGMDYQEYDPTPCCCCVPLQPGQRYLLCSDGLSDSLDLRQLSHCLGHGTPQNSAQTLIAAALEQGSADNITAMVLEIL